MRNSRNQKHRGAVSYGYWRVGALAAVFVLCCWQVGQSQTQEGNGGGFEIDNCGTLYSGDGPNNTPACVTDLTCASMAAGDDWAQGPGFHGIFNNDGEPNIDPGTGDPYRAIHAVDQNWGNQGDKADATQFGGVSNKNNDPIGDPLLYTGQQPWDWNGVGGGPQKNDITNTYVYTKVDSNDHRWLYLAFETRSTNGDSHVDFELNVAGLKVCDAGATTCGDPGGPPVTGVTDGLIIGLGTDNGRTVDHDFVVSTDFEQGGTVPIAHVRLWTETAPGVFEFIDVADLGVDTTGKIYTSTNICTIVHNTGGGDWTHFAGNGAPTSTLTALQFVECAIDLTGLGIDVNPCAPDTTLMFKTRSSQSFTAELKDWALLSFPLQPTPQCAIDGPTLVCPGEEGITYTAEETTGINNVTFEWTIAGNATFCDGTTTATGETVCVDADMVCDGNYMLIVTVASGECASTCLYIANIDDDVPPEITCPDNITVQCIDDVPDCDPDDATASDNCGPVTVTCEGDVSDGGSCPEIITRTFRATDFCGNFTECTQTITVNDIIPPVLSGCPDDATYQCIEDVPGPAEVTANDNCDGAIVPDYDQTTSGTCPTIITRTWTATDTCGNSTSCMQVITVDDTIPPVISCPADLTFECDAIGIFGTARATDNCDPEVEIILSEETVPGPCPQTYDIVRTFTASDECGNTTTCLQVIHIQDTTPPEITCPGPVEVQCLDDVPEPDANLIVATDNCGDVTVTFVGDVLSGVCPTIITRTYRATDECGLFTECTQTITVNDTIPPVLSGCPDDASVECIEDVPSPAAVTALDNCDGVLVPDYDQTTTGTCPTIITRTWTATDACGNLASCTQVITVNDTTAPVVDCDAWDDTLTTDSCCEVTITFSATVTDNCEADVSITCEAFATNGSVTVPTTCNTSVNPDGSLAVSGSFKVGDVTGCPVSATIVITATDACGNTQQCTDTVTYGLRACP